MESTTTGNSTTSTDSIAIFRLSGGNKARIDKNGNFYIASGAAYNTSGADFAESVEVRGPREEYEAGDVIAIEPQGERRFVLSLEAESTLVAGVYSTQPGVLASRHDGAGVGPVPAEEIPLAVVGIVPTKVCDEGGAIRAGDLLVAASVPGHARKAPRSPAVGSVLGKALGRLDSGRGVIGVLLVAR